MKCDWCGDTYSPTREDPWFEIKEKYSDDDWTDTNPAVAEICPGCMDRAKDLLSENR